jgi:CheY-like chemotaxis protein
LEAFLVFQHLSRSFLSWTVFFAVNGLVFAQEKAEADKKAEAKKGEEVKKVEDQYRTFFKKPETPLEYWAALNFEIDVGKYDLALEYLKGFLGRDPKVKSTAVTDEELVQIEAADGMSSFLRLLTIPQLREEAKPLLERVSAALKQHLGDSERIKKFIKNLSATAEERTHAINELRRSGAAAVPFLVDALRGTEGSTEHTKIMSALLVLDKSIVPPLLAALDIDDAGLRLDVLEILKQRAETSAVPYLWYPAASPQMPDLVRKKATEALAYFLGKRRDQLPPAKVALTQEAEKYYQHKVTFVSPEEVTVWNWDKEKKQLLSRTVTANEAEEFYGLRFAGQALDLDPAYQPAQVVYLSLALEKGFNRAGLDQPLEKGAPAVKELVKVVNPGLVNAVLERALADHRVAVILGSVRALGDLQDVRTIGANKNRAPPLVRALYYPDRRVQIAAADALLRMPSRPNPLAIGRTVEVLRRTANAEFVPKALVADASLMRVETLARTAKQAGFEPVMVRTGRQALKELKDNPDIDVIFIDHMLPDLGLPELVAQLRADIDVGLLPLFITVPEEQWTMQTDQALRRLTEPYQNVWVIPAKPDLAALKRVLAERIGAIMGKPLSEEERKGNAAMSMLWLKRMAVGEVPGYEVEPAREVILKNLESDELAGLAIEATGRLPGEKPQIKLADVVLSNNRPAPLRAQAALELVRHIQQHGLALPPKYAESLQALFDKTQDAKLKANVAVVMGALRPDSRQTGARLLRYSPPLPTPKTAPEAKEK